MRITVLCAGKIKEDYFNDAIAEYKKRLSRYCRLEIDEVADGPDAEAEADRFLKRLPEDAFIISLEIEGQQTDSVGFAKELERLGTDGLSRIVFLIGGSEGLSKRVTDRADLHLSFSRLTFPHKLMRVILLEQIYRAMRIIHHEPYHK